MVEVAWERREQQWSKRCPLPTARSQLPENHTDAAAAMPATTGMSSSLLRNVKFYIFTQYCFVLLKKKLIFEHTIECDLIFDSNSSVLSGELPPAMGKTALFYHSGSSGYESMLRDSSENTGSTSSAQDSLSEHSTATTSSRRSSKSSKKSRSNTGHNLFSKYWTEALACYCLQAV